MNFENIGSFRFYFYLIVGAFIIITLIYPPTTAKAYKNITPAEVKQLIDKKASNVIILDVRTPEEFHQGHIPKSINIPLQILNKQTAEQKLDRNAEIILYCQSGIRSRKAGQILDELGYTNVNMLGGIKDWPFEIVK